MCILWPAASERADACSTRLIALSGLVPDEDEKICLLAEILGWQVARAERSDGAPQHLTPRLALRQAGGLIMVAADDADLARQLARLGLDRLVTPVPLLALEQLLTLAG